MPKEYFRPKDFVGSISEDKETENYGYVLINTTTNLQF